MTATKFKVAICGGGIAGLALAATLSKYPDVDIEVFEAAEQYSEVGAGIGIWPRSFNVLRKLGKDVEDALTRAAMDYKRTEDYVPAFSYRQSGDQPEGINVFTMMTKGKFMTFHRADLQRILLSCVAPTCKMHTSKRLVSYSQPIASSSSPITLTFADGSWSFCDVLVGADGIKSVVRGCMMRDIARTLSGQEAGLALSGAEPVWCGVTAYRTLIDGEKLRACAPHHRTLREPTIYMAKDAFCVLYPISKGKFVNFGGFTLSEDLVRTSCETDTLEGKGIDGPWVRELSKEELCKHFERFEEETKPLLKCIEKGTSWAVHTVKPLRSYYNGRAVLIGDAAHGMMPFQGSGAGLGIEDAYLLATVLGHRSTRLETISDALVVYDTLRRPFTSDAALRSKLNGQLAAGQVPGVLLPNLGKIMTENSEWAWTTGLDGAIRDATRMLDSRIPSKL